MFIFKDEESIDATNPISWLSETVVPCSTYGLPTGIV